MSAFDHVESDGICIWDHEPWPCQTRKTVAEVLARVAVIVRPAADVLTACCDVHATTVEVRNDLADQIAEL